MKEAKMFETELYGFDEVKRELDKLGNKAKKLTGTNNVPFKELFTQSFLTKHTEFCSLDDMFGKSGFTVNSQEDFGKIPNEEWNKFISSNSHFHSWEEMMYTAGQEWIKRQLFGK